MVNPAPRHVINLRASRYMKGQHDGFEACAAGLTYRHQQSRQPVLHKGCDRIRGWLGRCRLNTSNFQALGGPQRRETVYIGS
jgi:hypothetical protein